MKKIFRKENLDDTLIKGIVAVIIFQITYTFVYSIILSDFKPLIFIANAGYPMLYSIITLLIGALPYILCGYLIMLGRNRKERLEEKNGIHAFSIFAIMILFYIIVSILQLIFEYRDFYSLFIFSNLPLLRGLLFLELSNMNINFMMLFSCVILPLFIYIGGALRLRVLKEELDGQDR